jgi:hypothetical protein
VSKYRNRRKELVDAGVINKVKTVSNSIANSAPLPQFCWFLFGFCLYLDGFEQVSCLTQLSKSVINTNVSLRRLAVLSVRRHWCFFGSASNAFE